MTDQASGVTILDPDWPGRPLPMLPGDLSRMVPQGLGLGVPLIVTPYGTGPSAGFYALDQPSGDPFHGAPTQEPCGGLLYFDDGVDLGHLRGALAVIGVHTGRRDFAVFAGRSEDAVAERYLDQVRIVSKAGLSHFFDVDRDAKALPDQPIGLGDYVETFIAAQKAKWNDPEYAYSRSLGGTLGGDGDWAKESLAFGFFVENTPWGVYRLWSRPWLVTK